MRNKPTIGQELIMYSRHTHQYKTVTVSKVGRQYFTVEPMYADVRFRIEDWVQDTQYGANYILYRDRGEIRDEITRNIALQSLEHYFSSFGRTKATTVRNERVSTAQLMQACAVLGLTEAVREKVSDKLGEFLDDKNL